MGWGGQFYFAISVGIISTALGRAANTNREEEKKTKEGHVRQLFFQSCKLWEYIAKFGLTS